MAIAALIAFSVAARVSPAQDSAMDNAPAYSGGVFVTPVPGAPFSAEVVLDMTQVLKEGTSFKRKTAAVIARDSQGRIRNERHEVLPASSKQAPIIYSVHLYDPTTRLSTLLNPKTHIAAQKTLDRPPSIEPPVIAWLRSQGMHPSDPNIQVKDLGASVMDGLDVHGYLRSIEMAAKDSGTDLGVVVTDEYWYCEELHINLFTRHNDPRTGQSLMTVTRINVNEPDVDLFKIPPDYKLVDMTPPDLEDPNAVPVE
jgi:hypothetical protein